MRIAALDAVCPDVPDAREANYFSATAVLRDSQHE
jgi:hypothetical protein